MSNMIHMVISGNLTGFSHFYASPQAKSLLGEAPFDFDYRNYLTFLNSGEKAYVLSFAPSVVAMSVVTRILDSFRRPGLLAVTLLVPRGEQVVLAAGQSKDAPYRLLNDLYERFMERCFVNGMLNQNAAVLMQDYYADIVSRYALAPDGRQRAVNTAINVRTNIKRAGYVQTAENLVPLYLASPWRSSYEGFHHVFLAQHPKENLIDEQPEEVMLYRVTVSNTGQTIPAVRLTDKIPVVMPGEGEKDIASKNFTYQQVLNGEARGIVARLQNETIELTYRFVQEEKTIQFKFMFQGKKGKFESLAPRLRFADGREVQLPSEAYTFLGAEINSSVTVLISDPALQVQGGPIDLRRLKDGATCTVQLVNSHTHTEPPVRIKTDPSNRTGQTVSNQTDSTQTVPSQTVSTQTASPQTVPSRTGRVTILSSSEHKSKPNPNPNVPMVKAAAILSLVCVAAYLVVASFTQWWPFEESLSQEEVVANSVISKTVVVTFADASGDPLTSSSVEGDLFNDGRMTCSVNPHTALKKKPFDTSKMAFTYTLTGSKTQKIEFAVTVDGVKVCVKKFELDSIGDRLTLRLNVNASEIEWYFNRKNWIETNTPERAKKDYNTVIHQISKLSSDLREKLKRMLDEKAGKAASDEASDHPNPSANSKPKAEANKHQPQNDGLGDNLPDGSKNLISGGGKIDPKNGKTQAQIDALKAYNALSEVDRKKCKGATTYQALKDKVDAINNTNKPQTGQQ